MARIKKIPKRLPPVSKRLVSILNELQNIIPEIARFERSHAALDAARQALDFSTDQETTKPKERKKKIDLSPVITSVCSTCIFVPNSSECKPDGLTLTDEIITACPGHRTIDYHACMLCQKEGNPDNCQPGEGLIMNGELVAFCPMFIEKPIEKKSRKSKKEKGTNGQ